MLQQVSWKVELLNSEFSAAVPRARARDVVFIVVHTTTFLTELVPLGRLLRERAGVETIFYCAFTHWTADKFAESCAQEGITCLRDTGSTKPA